jgi:large conductance mechanosensitive channel
MERTATRGGGTVKIVEEFQKFVLRGNIVDLAIGFTVGAAFTTAVRSMVEDLIMPAVGVVLGDVDFGDLFLVLDPGTGPGGYRTLAQAEAAGAVTLNYGLFLNSAIALLLVALVMFAIIRAVNRLLDRLEDDRGRDDDAPEEPDNKKCMFCRSTIHYRAVRCPYCTSALAAAEGAASSG